jgi:hypothetical protein
MINLTFSFISLNAEAGDVDHRMKGGGNGACFKSFLKKEGYGI